MAQRMLLRTPSNLFILFIKMRVRISYSHFVLSSLFYIYATEHTEALYLHRGARLKSSCIFVRVTAEEGGNLNPQINTVHQSGNKISILVTLNTLSARITPTTRRIVPHIIFLISFIIYSFFLIRQEQNKITMLIISK